MCVSQDLNGRGTHCCCLYEDEWCIKSDDISNPFPDLSERGVNQNVQFDTERNYTFIGVCV